MTKLWHSYILGTLETLPVDMEERNLHLDKYESVFQLPFPVLLYHFHINIICATGIRLKRRNNSIVICYQR